MSERTRLDADHTFRAPTSYGREAYGPADAGQGAEGVPSGPDDVRTRRLAGEEGDQAASYVGHEAAGTGARLRDGGTEPARSATRVDETLVSPARRRYVAAEGDVPGAQGYRNTQAGQEGYQRRVRRQEAAQAPAQTDRRVLHRQASARRDQPDARQRGTYRQARRPVPAPRGYADDYERGGYVQPEPDLVPRRLGGNAGRAAARGVLLFLSWVCRLSAIGLAILVVLDSLTVGNRMVLMQVTSNVANLLPRSLSGLYVLDTPFGGAFRGDFAIASVVLFVLDWVCVRVRHALAR